MVRDWYLNYKSLRKQKVRIIILDKSKFMLSLIAALIFCLLLTNCAATSQKPDQNQPALETSNVGSGDRIKAAEELLNVMGLEDALQKSIDQMLQIQLDQEPAMRPYKNVMLKFFNKHMSYEMLKDDMTVIYADAFDENELYEIIKFYKTATGQKTIEKMPELMSKGAKLGISRVKENIHELQDMVKKEAERIEQLQNE